MKKSLWLGILLLLVSGFAVYYHSIKVAAVNVTSSYGSGWPASNFSINVPVARGESTSFTVPAPGFPLSDSFLDTYNCTIYKNSPLVSGDPGYPNGPACAVVFDSTNAPSSPYSGISISKGGTNAEPSYTVYASSSVTPQTYYLTGNYMINSWSTGSLPSHIGSGTMTLAVNVTGGDSTPPSITAYYNSNSVPAENSPSISQYSNGFTTAITATDNVSLNSLVYCVSSDLCNPSTTISSSGTTATASVYIPYNETSKRICYYATDAVGNRTPASGSSCAIVNRYPVVPGTPTATIGTNKVTVAFADNSYEASSGQDERFLIERSVNGGAWTAVNNTFTSWMAAGSSGNVYWEDTSPVCGSLKYRVKVYTWASTFSAGPSGESNVVDYSTNCPSLTLSGVPSSVTVKKGASPLTYSIAANKSNVNMGVWFDEEQGTYTLDGSVTNSGTETASIRPGTLSIGAGTQGVGTYQISVTASGTSATPGLPTPAKADTSVTVIAPDLTAGSVSFTSPVYAGSSKTFSSTITNNSGTYSSATGGGFTSTYQFDNTGTSGVDRYVQVSSTELAAGGSTTAQTTQSLTAGNWQVRLCAGMSATQDSDPWTFTSPYTESNQSNNCGGWTSFSVTAAPQPDLTAGAVSPTSATVGQSVQYSATISNTGSVQAGGAGTISHVFQVNNSDTSAVNASTTFINGSDTGGIAAGGSATTSANITFNSAGIKRIRACADWTGGVTESDEGNNCGDWTAITVQALPTYSDLTADAPTWTPPVVIGQAKTYYGTVRNIGDAQAGGTGSLTHTFQFDNNGDSVSDNNLTFTSGGIAASGSYSGSVSFTFNSAGSKQVRLCAATYTNESNTGNNCSAWAAITVVAPDLTASSINPTTVPNGDATFTATVANFGDYPTGTSFQNTFYFDDDATHTSGVTQANVSAGPLLQSGNNQSVTATHPFQAGTRYVNFCADTGTPGVVTESNESNNCSGWTAITVTNQGFSLSVTSAASYQYDSGTVGNFPITLTRTGGFTGAVNLSFSSSPGNYFFDSSFAPVTIASGSTASTFTAVVEGAPNGTYTILITGTSGSLTANTSITITIAAPVGSLSVDTCQILDNASTCNAKVSWGVTNPISGANTAVTKDKPSANTVVPGTSSTSGTDVLSAVGYGITNFYLYHNGGPLKGPVQVNVVCNNPASTWDGTKCAPADGTLSASDCTILTGNSTCNSTVSWQVNNPVTGAQTAVTKDKPAANTAVPNTSATSGTVSVPISSGVTNFFLYHNVEQFATDPATATCEAGSTWSGTTCAQDVLPMSGTLTPSAYSCSIPLDQSACTVNLSWTTTNPQGTSAVTSNWPSAGTVVYTGNSGSNQPVSIPYSSRTFYLYNNSVSLVEPPLTVTSSCGQGVWDGAKCSAITGSLSISPLSCQIADGNSTCTVTGATWITSGASSPALVDRNVNSTLSTAANNSTPLSVWVAYPQTVFDLKDGASTLDTETVTASCFSGNWNGSTGKCDTSSTPSPENPNGDTTGALSVPDCEIGNGASSCNTSVTWSVSNPLGGSTIGITKDKPSANTAVPNTNSAGGTVSVTLSYGNTNFFLYQNGVEPPLATDPAQASCVSGTAWNSGSGTCQTVIASPTSDLSVNPPSIVVGGSATLTWSSTNATSCTGTGFSTGGATSGSITVNPTVTTTYTIVCTGAGGQSSDIATLTVTTADKKPIYVEP